MNGKKANWAFLLEVLGYMALVFGLAWLWPGIMETLS